MIKKVSFKLILLSLSLVATTTITSDIITPENKQKIINVCAAGALYYAAYKTGNYLGWVIVSMRKKYQDYQQRKKMQEIEDLQEKLNSDGLEIYESKTLLHKNTKDIKISIGETIVTKRDMSEILRDIHNNLTELKKKFALFIEYQEKSIENFNKMSRELDQIEQNFSGYATKKMLKKDFEKELLNIYVQTTTEIHSIDDITVDKTHELTVATKICLERCNELIDTIEEHIFPDQGTNKNLEPNTNG